MKYTKESFIEALGVSVMPDEFGMHFDETMAEYDELGAPYLSDEFLENIQAEFNLFTEKYEFVKREAKRVRESDLLSRYSMLMKRMMIDKDEMALVTLPEVPVGKTEAETVDLEMAAFFAQFAYLPEMVEYYRRRNLPERIIRDTLNDTFEGGIRVNYSCFGRDGYEINRSFMWNQHYLGHRIIRVGVLAFEMKKDFSDAVRIFVNDKGEYIILSNGQEISKRGQITGSTNDTDVAFVAAFSESEDGYEGYLVDTESVSVTTERVYLPKREWRPAILADDHVINVHIPESKDFCRETVEAAYRECYEVISRSFPEFKPRAFTCFSWLLDPHLKELLRDGSNILAFQSQYKIFPVKSSGKAPYRFLFRVPFSTEVEDLPEHTSLQRRVKALYLDGECIYAPGGIIFIDDVINS